MASLDERLLKSRGWVWICRCLIWFIAIGFLASETREVFQLQQITQLTQFALFFLLANYQLSIARYHQAGRDDALALKLKSCSLQMFFASVLAVSDAALDELIHSIVTAPIAAGGLLTGTLFVVGWLINVAMILIAALSLDRTIRLLGRNLRGA